MKMKKMCLVFGLIVATASAAVVDFEEFSLAPESYYRGDDLAAGFSSQGVNFSNSCNPDWEYWDGWAYSNTTDTTTPGYANQFSAITGGGADDSANYGVSFTGFAPGTANIQLPAGVDPVSASFTNTTYAALSMQNGDGVAKAFGGTSGDDEDWFLLTITGTDASDQQIGVVEFYLADYRFEDSNQDYIINEWTEVDLSGLAGSTELSFWLTSSDNGQYGMNTPGYFAMDNFVITPEPATAILLLSGGWMLLRRRK